MKKRFIVVSLHGYVIDYGIMDESVIIQVAKKMIDVNKGQKIGCNYLCAITNNLSDLFVLSWIETPCQVVNVL